MRLKSLNYLQFENDPREWGFNKLVLNDVNLIVGKNAVGKSRIMSVIFGLSALLSARTKMTYSSGRYDVQLEHEGEEIFYALEFRENRVVHEEYRRGKTVLLTRGVGGAGKIFAERENKHIDFQSPEDELAAVTRRDSLQHPYLEPLYQWASRVLFYHFGTSLGRDSILLYPGIENPTIDLRNENAVVGIYIYGYGKLGDDYDLAIREDMQAIGYDLEDIKSTELTSLQMSVPGQLGTRPIGLAVKERDLPGITEHTDISTGMFRALSLFVQLNYAFMDKDKYASCVLIDDIGEGLDYDRSCLLINRLMYKAAQAGIQLVMTTNDRFVMNNVPLETWSVLQRSGGHVEIFNYENSKQIFDDFKYSGLNNFDFFAYDYLNQTVTEEEEDVEAGNLR